MSIAAEFDIVGKIFVVVGGGRGIGRAIVEVLAEAGCDGVIVALTPKYLMPSVERIRNATGRNLIGIAADATSTYAMDSVFKRAMKEFGRVDIWINAAGDHVHAPLVPLPSAEASGDAAESLSDERFRSILDLNLVTVHAGCRAVGAHFVKEGRGRLINIGSLLGRVAGGEYSTYVAAKAGVEGLTRSLALEWARFGITVNCIAPGSFPDTDIEDEEQMAVRHEWASQAVPVGRVGSLRELGLLVVFLASEASSYITGQTLYIDGGLGLGRIPEPTGA